MTVLFVLLTFAVFLALDAWAHRHEPVLAAATSPAMEPEGFRLEPVWVGGYQVPDGVHFHRGHTWARTTGNDTAVVGIDDFARRLVGPADRVTLPQVGSWVRSGEATARLGVAGREAELVAPIEGVVVETNPLLEHDPGLATSDPYGRGWLYKVQTGELGRNLRNLFTGSLAHRFFEDAKEKLQLELMALSGSVLADGGEPAEDFASHLAEDDWRRLTHEFLLG
ncbi:MAG: glycine cleavage system protein H [Thermoanaerobaculia bacterium]